MAKNRNIGNAHFAGSKSGRTPLSANTVVRQSAQRSHRIKELVHIAKSKSIQKL